MHLGVFSFNTEYGIRPDEMARALEDRGYESFWAPEHTHIPASRLSPYPGGGDLPRPYYHMADPFVSLMAAAAATNMATDHPSRNACWAAVARSASPICADTARAWPMRDSGSRVATWPPVTASSAGPA